jgi:hypothetical protein
MSNNKDKYTDKSGDKKYFAMIPYYIVNHSSHYEQSLYLVMKRLASEEGTCWASAATLGKMMSSPESKEKVSPNTVRKYREKLIKRGWIKKVGQKGKTKPTDEFEIVDLWELNMKFYAQKESSTSEQSPKESSTSAEIVQPVRLVSSLGGEEEETIKKNYEEEHSRESLEEYKTDPEGNLISKRKAGQSVARGRLAFADFWSLYPRKENQKSALRAWLGLTTEKQAAALADIPRRKAASQWREEDGRFIPSPYKYLADERWADALPARPSFTDYTKKQYGSN